MGFKTLSVCLLLAFLGMAVCVRAEGPEPSGTSVKADLAGRSGHVASSSVFRILCQAKNRNGTGFLHKSGKIITAAHIVADCQAQELIAVGASGNRIQIKNMIVKAECDLALLIPQETIRAPSLSISMHDSISVGAQVSTWGYPAGYNGLSPLLSSGYIAGLDQVKSGNGKWGPQLVVNAAFNSGNSGGPLLELEMGNVIGMVSSKLAPMPQHLEQALEALKQDQTIGHFVWTRADGTKEKMSTAQLVAEILQYLRDQTQLVVGYAVLGGELRNFLKENGIEP